ncbi:MULTISPECIES: pentapeptide repeat-containing protein [Fischerella]|nr:pentapeptide repeat-containing protein [Fischerella muscicola]
MIGADFSGADIRGCNITNTLLWGANFKQVKFSDI